MDQSIETGMRGSWKWGNGRGRGTVEEIFHESVTRTLQGAEVTRHGSNDDPALLLRQDDGARVLKLRSEVEFERAN